MTTNQLLNGIASHYVEKQSKESAVKRLKTEAMRAFSALDEWSAMRPELPGDGCIRIRLLGQDDTVDLCYDDILSALEAAHQTYATELHRSEARR